MKVQFTTTRKRMYYYMHEGLDVKVIRQQHDLVLIENTVNCPQDIQKVFYAGATYGADCMVEYGKALAN